MPAAFTLGAIAPQDSFNAFAARGLLRPSFRWQEVWQAEHARAFAVAGVMRLDVLRTIRDQVDSAVANGTGFPEFEQALKRQLVAKGFWGNVEITDPATGEVRTTKFNQQRLQLIFDVNMRQSHAAGRWARITRSRSQTHIVYRTMRDERVRASHRPWDDVVLPKDHPWWQTHFPPNGWRCRCTAFGIDERGIDKLRAAGAKLKTEAPPSTFVEFENRSTGQVERVPRGIDPGFAYNPGAVHVEQGLDQLARGLASLRAPRVPGSSSLDLRRKAVARTRSERAFRDFLADPPPGTQRGLPVAAVPAAAGEPPLVAVRASDLLRQADDPVFPPLLPTKAASWALAQTIIDRGQRLDLPGGAVLWWWARGAAEARRVHVLELQRGDLAWAAQGLATLSVDEAVTKYPPLAGLV